MVCGTEGSALRGPGNGFWNIGERAIVESVWRGLKCARYDRWNIGAGVRGCAWGAVGGRTRLICFSFRITIKNPNSWIILCLLGKLVK